MPPSRVGKYELLDRIGAGGMAEIHLARVAGAAGFEKLVVVKRLLPELAHERDFVAQFVDEARLAASFAHGNIAATFDFGEADGSYYIAMEYVEGKNLRAIHDTLQTRKREMPIPAAVQVVAEAALGLDHAHSRTDSSGAPMKVVHRDVSPQNIMVSYGGDVKVLDFGIARSAAKEFRTRAGVVKGKLRYMSPEQVRGLEIDGRSDQFGVGVVLWELLYGRRPLPELTETELANWIARGEFEKPADAPAIDADLEAILNRAIAVDPADRFPTCGDLSRALSRWLAEKWPAWTRADLAALLEREFADEIRRERGWIGHLLERSREAAAAGALPEAQVIGPEAPPAPRTPAPSVSAPVPGGTKVIDTDAPAPSRRRGVFVALAGLAVVGAGIAAALGVGPFAPVATVTTPAPTVEPTATATALAAATPSAEPSSSPSPTAEPVRTHVAVRATPRRTATPLATATPIAAPTTATPAPTATPTAVAVVTPVGPKGYLDVSADPFAMVFLDGKPVSETPIRKREVSAGAHVLTLVNHKAGFRWENAVLVVADKTTVVKADVREKKVKVSPGK